MTARFASLRCSDVRCGSNPALGRYPQHFRLAIASGIRRAGAR